jgi:hypothetical protein
MMEYISELTRERVRYRANGYGPSVDITSPNGSHDAFYIKIDQHYGASDHVTYMQHGIPAVMFITWPDMWYHSSQDLPDKQDPTQYKRAAIVGTGALAVIATGGDELAARVTAENLSRGTERLGAAERKGTSYLADAASPEALQSAWKEARIAIGHQAAVEKDVIASSSVLYADPGAPKRLAPIVASIDKTAAALTEAARSVYANEAQRLNVQPVYEPAQTAEEKEAANLIVECASAAPTYAGCGGGGRGGAGGRGGGAGGRGGGGPGGGARGPSLPQHMNAELAILLGQHKSVLEIRNFLSGEFEPVSLADVMAVLRAREAQGTIKLVPRAAAAKAVR